jgi:hypothetical protein
MTVVKAPLVRDAAAQRSVFTQAQRRHLEWLEKEAPIFLAEPVDRKAFNRLEKACKELDAALQETTGATHRSNRALLLASLQRLHGGRNPQRFYLQQLDDIAELVGAVAFAAAVIGGRGGQADMHKRAWVWEAARRWRMLGEVPSGAERGRFWNALDDFQLSDARSPGVPLVTRAIVVEALKMQRPASDEAGESAAIARL